MRLRLVNPAHQHYQVDLKRHLNAKHVRPELERDFVDVGFWVKDRHFIGEIKVTNCLTPSEAFRIAIGLAQFCLNIFPCERLRIFEQELLYQIGSKVTDVVPAYPLANEAQFLQVASARKFFGAKSRE